MIIALMVAQLLPNVGTRVLEVGTGTGAHASVFLRVARGIRSFTGIDVCSEALALARDIVPEVVPQGELEELAFVESLLQDYGPGDWDTVYCTCTIPATAMATIAGISSHRPLIIQAPRLLSRVEYEQEPKTSWLRARYGDFDNYKQIDACREYLVLSVLSVDARGTIKELDKLYDVSFVPFKYADVNEDQSCGI